MKPDSGDVRAALQVVEEMGPHETTTMGWSGIPEDDPNWLSFRIQKKRLVALVAGAIAAAKKGSEA